MPRCVQCHSQWATYFRCPHCERKFPCPLQLFLVSIALPLLILVAVYLLFSFRGKLEDWRAVQKDRPPDENGLTVEIDKSSVQ